MGEEYKPLTDEEIEKMVAHDMAIWEENMKDMPPMPDENAELEARVAAKIQSVRAEFMRWTLAAFMVAVAISVALFKL